MIQGAQRVCRVLMACFLLLGTADCRTNPVPPKNCFPEAASAWLESERHSTERHDETGPFKVYIDGSGSMAGFATPPDRSFEDILGALPTLADRSAGSIGYVRFGMERTPIQPSRLLEVLKPDFYTCSSCDNKQSRIDLLFQEIESAGPGATSIVVTDLWLKNSTQLTSDPLALSQPLIRILRGGRAIMIYGIEAGYQGRVYDLPSGRKDVTANRRPFYLMVIGPPSVVTAFHTRMDRFLPSYITDSFRDGGAHFSLFTTNPIPAASRSRVTFSASADRAMSNHHFFQHVRDFKVDQYVIDLGRALRAKSRSALSWTGPELADIAPGTVWSGPIQPRLEVWRMVHDDASCSREDWRPVRDVEQSLGWQAGVDAAGRHRFELHPDEFARAFGRGSYLVTGEARRASLHIPNPASAWMRDWGFAAEQESAALARRPGYVPTLNLPDMAKIMDGALAEAAERPDRPGGAALGGFTVAIKVE